MKNLVTFLILIAIVGFAIFYIIKKKKKGAKCIGCPYSDCCKKGSFGKHLN